MQWYAGTSGYSYKPWKGPFYPEDLPDDEMLGYYAERLPAVEINNTFYRMPRSAVLEKWAAAVPEHFRFVIKASRRITHQQRLKDAADPTRYLLDKVAALGDKLGALLFQLPPYLRCDPERLQAFLALLPAGTPAAFEFRHDSWDTAEIRAMLADAGAALCVADSEDGGAPPELPGTPWLYLRLRRPDYTDADLRRWLERAEASGADTGFVFFKHEDEGAAPALAGRFLELTAKQRAARAPKSSPARRSGTRKRA